MRWRGWWRRSRPAAPRVGQRAKRDATSRIDLSQLAPPAADLLAHACATTLILAEDSARVAREAWSVVDQDALARSASALFQRYEKLRTLLADYANDPMQALVAPLDFQREQFARMTGESWIERVATIHVAGGFLDDVYAIVSEGLPQPARSDISRLVRAGIETELIAQVIERICATDSAHQSRLSLWSRRLVGDVMLIARRALQSDEGGQLGQSAYEPVFTDVITEHTRRLDRLGLTA